MAGGAARGNGSERYRHCGRHSRNSSAPRNTAAQAHSPLVVERQRRSDEDPLRELGWKMTVRRFELLKPHMGEAATTTAMTFPILTGAALAGLCAVVAWAPVKSFSKARPSG